MPLVALALLLAQLVSVPAPNGGTVEADPALDWGLRVLASLDEARPLVQAFADGGERIVVAPEAPGGRLALYEPRRRTVSIAPEVAHVAPGTLATLLAHEASHVQTYISGTGASWAALQPPRAANAARHLKLLPGALDSTDARASHTATMAAPVVSPGGQPGTFCLCA